MSRRGRGIPWRPVDVVALVLATGLTLSISLILLVTGIQVVIGGSFPQVSLSENATQILIAGTGGLTGLLGAYIGLNRNTPKAPPPGSPPAGERDQPGTTGPPDPWTPHSASQSLDPPTEVL